MAGRFSDQWDPRQTVSLPRRSKSGRHGGFPDGPARDPCRQRLFFWEGLVQQPATKKNRTAGAVYFFFLGAGRPLFWSFWRSAEPDPAVVFLFFFGDPFRGVLPPLALGRWLKEPFAGFFLINASLCPEGTPFLAIRLRAAMPFFFFPPPGGPCPAIRRSHSTSSRGLPQFFGGC